ncbi:MAG TPA: hypothetical protein VHE08_02920 [Solirubrobacterales bacterium]|nr:hypothetical protein [Solirubrobacterales bacterium]
MAGLDFTSPYDELTELRAVLTTQEIAELTGLRRETISRARPDSRFRRRTEKALGDLYLVVTRMRSIAGEDIGHLAAILRRPQAALGDRSIAEMLKDGKVSLVLEHLAAPERSTRAATPRPGEPPEGAVAAFLAADPELDTLLPEIEAKIREHFGPRARIERGIIEDFESGEDDVFYLRVRDDLSVDENIARLTALLAAEWDLLSPVTERLTIGFL